MTRTALGASLVVLTVWSVSGQGSAAPQAPVRPDVGLPAESAGWDKVVENLLSAFDRVDLVALGEAHGRRVDSELRIRLIRHPDFPSKARFIVVEFAGTAHQPILDRYVQGENVPVADLEQLWPKTTIPTVYEEFLAAVRDVNRTLPSEKRLRVLAGDPLEGTLDRNEFPVSLLRDHVFKRREKALVIYGSGHVWHGEGGITRALQQGAPAKVLVVESLAAPTPRDTLQAFERLLQSDLRPVLVSLRGTRAGRVPAAHVFPNEDFGPTLTLGDLDDACVFFGQEIEAVTAAPSVVETLDTAKPLTLTGTLAGFLVWPAHVYLLIAVKGESGRVEQWAVEGNSEAALVKAGWKMPPGGTVKLGDPISVRAHFSKQNVTDTVPPSERLVVDLARVGRLVRGSDVTLGDGRKLVFGAAR